MEQYYTLQEVMARLNISRDTIMGLIRKGKIPGTIKLSNVFRIPESGIQRFLEAQTVQPHKPSTCRANANRPTARRRARRTQVGRR